MYIAQFNIARIRYPLNDERMADFVSNIDRVHRIADRVGGLVYRLKGENGNATDIRVFDDPTLVPNLTIWENVQCLKKFVFATAHKMFFNRRDEWFLPVDGPKNVMWFCAETYRPKNMLDGELRLEYIKLHGSTEYAFDWEYLSAPKA